MQTLLTAGDPPIKTIRKNEPPSITFNKTIKTTITNDNRCLHFLFVRMLQLC